MSKLMSPSGRQPKRAKRFPLARRVDTLTGKTVALYHNDKMTSFWVMRTVRELLESLKVKEIFEAHSRAPLMRHPDRAIEEALAADAVFVGTADEGSDTCYVVDAAVRIEKRGKPTVLVVSIPAFRELVASHSEMYGLPYLPFVIVGVHQENPPNVYIPAVKKIFEKMVKGLTTPSRELEANIPGEIK